MRKILGAGLLSMVASAAFAINASVFLEAPVTRLSAEELKEFVAFVDKTLDQAPEGVLVEWRAPKTKFVSKLTPGKRTTEGGRECREMTIESESGDRYQRGRYLFCKVASGAWEFRLPKAATGTK
jgi:surface antigen